jgi:hypothetical protein
MREVAPAPAGELVTLDTEPVDPRFARIPTVRHALTLVVPGAGGGKVSVRETTNGARVTVTDENGFARSLDLNVVELRTLAQHANRIARRVAFRPDDTP